MSTASAKNKLNIYWFRLTDLRLHDNPALSKCLQQASNQNILPLVCLDTSRVFGNEARSRLSDSLKCDARRAQFILQSVQDLRTQLQAQGANLMVATGKPEDVLDGLLQKAKASSSDDALSCTVTCQEEVCSEELSVDKAVRSVLKLHNPKNNLQTVWGSTLYEPDDLPFPDNVYGIPNTFTPFRNKVEKLCSIPAPLAAPTNVQLSSLANVLQSDTCSLSYMPSLQDLGYTEAQIQQDTKHDERGVLQFVGGESAALKRGQSYIWDKDLLKVYFDTRNGMLGGDYSTKLAPWLAHGCVSPRHVARECQKYERARVQNKSTYWVVFELLWRDYFKFFAKKHGNRIFFPGGTANSDKEWKHGEKWFQAWKEGRTGYPLVDANMRELAATGFMSNRGRQNVCSFLALDMNQDWRYGAEYFESVLLDYDVHSNWGNWCSGAGMTGGRVNRFNIVKQSKDYDCHGEYVKHWLPELKDLPANLVHEPWKMTQFQQMEYGVRLGVDYPNPIVPPFAPGSREGGKNNKGRGNNKGGNKRNGPNPNRGRGQRQDMKSLKEGTIRMR